MNDDLIPNAGDRIICVKVGKVRRENFYEMARKYWRVDGIRATRSNHVLAIVDGVVKEDYTPSSWNLTDNPKYEGRWEFEGKPVENSVYIGKSVASYYGKSQNPVKYINM